MTTLDTLRQLQAEATPGPWEYDEASEYVWAGEDNILWNTTEIHANGHLAAAAPTHLADLITALEREQRIREVHIEAERPRVTFGPTITRICAHDGHPYPCLTIRILDGNE